MASPIAVSNFSFESPSGSALNGPLDPANGSIGLWNYQRTGATPATLTDVTFGQSALATDGTNIATLTFLVGASASLTLNQDLGVTLLPNSIYTLRVDADQIISAPLLTSARISITAGGAAQQSLMDNSLLSMLDGTGPLNTITLTLTTGATPPSGDLGVEFQIGGVAQTLGAGLELDNVRMDVSAVPEPSSLSLGIAAGVCWLLFGRFLGHRQHQVPSMRPGLISRSRQVRQPNHKRPGSNPLY